jgi:hypothetical protein
MPRSLSAVARLRCFFWEVSWSLNDFGELGIRVRNYLRPLIRSTSGFKEFRRSLWIPRDFASARSYEERSARAFPLSAAISTVVPACRTKFLSMRSYIKRLITPLL